MPGPGGRCSLLRREIHTIQRQLSQRPTESENLVPHRKYKSAQIQSRQLSAQQGGGITLNHRPMWLSTRTAYQNKESASRAFVYTKCKMLVGAMPQTP